MILCLLCSSTVQILTLFINEGNIRRLNWSLKELLDAEEPMDESHQGGEKAGAEEADGHPGHELLLVDVPDDVLLGKQRDGGVAEDLDGSHPKQPDEVDDEGAAEEESHAAAAGEVDGEGAGKVVEEVAVGDEDGDGAEEEEDGDGSADALHHDGVGEESSGDDDHRVLPEVDEEVGEAEEAEENAGCCEKAVGDLETPLRALLVLRLLPSWVRIRDIHLEIIFSLTGRKNILKTHPVSSFDNAAVGHEDREREHKETLGVVRGKIFPLKIILKPIFVLPLPDQEDVRLQSELGPRFQKSFHGLELLEVVAHELERSMVPSTDQQSNQQNPPKKKSFQIQILI